MIPALTIRIISLPPSKQRRSVARSRRRTSGPSEPVVPGVPFPGNRSRRSTRRRTRRKRSPRETPCYHRRSNIAILESGCRPCFAYPRHTNTKAQNNLPPHSFVGACFLFPALNCLCETTGTITATDSPEWQWRLIFKAVDNHWYPFSYRYFTIRFITIKY